VARAAAEAAGAAAEAALVGAADPEGVVVRSAWRPPKQQLRLLPILGEI